VAGAPGAARPLGLTTTSNKGGRMAQEFEQTDVTIWSEGARLAGELFRPSGAGTPGPAILFCHGWGGVKSHLIPRYAEAFARAGYVCLFFDYRGWGESDGKLIAAAGAPQLTEAGTLTIPVRVIRQVVDPLDEIADIRACLAWLMTEQGVDPDRVGLWGSSYGGGLTTYVAGTDSRVKALVAQIGSYGHSAKAEFRDWAYKQMADKARALIDPPIPQPAAGPSSGGLAGVGDLARQYGYAPAKVAEGVRAPTLFIDAEFEEYYADEPQLQGGAVYETVRQRAIAERVTFPCTHYKLYDDYLEPARAQAIAWFDKHL
jgi:dienelactone hydrolase